MNFLVILLSALLWSGCVGQTSRVETTSDEPFSDTETGSKDLIIVAEKMTASLLRMPQIMQAPKPPRIAFADVKNETSEIINKNLFIEKMRTLLMKNAAGKMVFLDREISMQIEQEREDKRAGKISSSKSSQRSGADFFLTGKLASIDKVSGSKRSTYTRYAFRLTDAETSDILWEDDYEVKKVGSSGLYDR